MFGARLRPGRPPNPRTLSGLCQALWVLRLIRYSWEEAEAGRALAGEGEGGLPVPRRPPPPWRRSEGLGLWAEGTSQQSTGPGGSWVRASRSADGLPSTRRQHEVCCDSGCCSPATRAAVHRAATLAHAEGREAQCGPEHCVAFRPEPVLVEEEAEARRLLQRGFHVHGEPAGIASSNSVQY